MPTPESALLFGYARAVPLVPAFVVPIFHRNNVQLVQKIGPKDDVIGFRDIDCSSSSVKEIKQSRRITVGDPSMWGFEFSEEHVSLDNRHQLTDTLLDHRTEFQDKPLLSLQVFRFCNATAEIPGALLRAYQHLEAGSARTARVWRDTVILRPLVRQAIATAAGDLTVAGPNMLLDEIDIAVTEPRYLNIILPPILLGIISSKARKSAIEYIKNTSSIFGLDVVRLGAGGPPNKLFVGGIPYRTTAEELQSYFSKIGYVVSASVVTDRETGRSRGFGFVEMFAQEDAEAAVQAFNGVEFGGRQLTVSAARPKAS